jgi:hypothetical protein
MRDQLMGILLERTRARRSTEAFLLAGPPATTRRAPNRVQHAALVADIRRQPRRGSHSFAA